MAELPKPSPFQSVWRCDGAPGSAGQRQGALSGCRSFSIIIPFDVDDRIFNLRAGFFSNKFSKDHQDFPVFEIYQELYNRTIRKNGAPNQSHEMDNDERILAARPPRYATASCLVPWTRRSCLTSGGDGGFDFVFFNQQRKYR